MGWMHSCALYVFQSSMLEILSRSNVAFQELPNVPCILGRVISLSLDSLAAWLGTSRHRIRFLLRPQVKTLGER